MSKKCEIQRNPEFFAVFVEVNKTEDFCQIENFSANWLSLSLLTLRSVEFDDFFFVNVKEFVKIKEIHKVLHVTLVTSVW